MCVEPEKYVKAVRYWQKYIYIYKKGAPKYGNPTAFWPSWGRCAESQFNFTTGYNANKSNSFIH